MTCQGCVATVSKKLAAVQGVEGIEVSLENNRATVVSKRQLPIADLQNSLGVKYTILEETQSNSSFEMQKEKSKWAQLYPLFLIFAYLFGASILLNLKAWSISEAMLDFMGLFYIVFSFFKFLDLRGFPKSFGMYDPLTKAIPVYGWIYPFLELGLGLLFLVRFQVPFALITTVIILGITTFGVTRALLDKKRIQCACLGTALKLPMTEATFIENAIMLVMAGCMLARMFL